MTWLRCSAQSQAQVLREGWQLLLFQNHLSGLQGQELAAHIGGGMHSRAAQDTQWAPADSCPGQPVRAGSEAAASEAQPEGGGRRKAPVGTRRVGQRGCPTLS